MLKGHVSLPKERTTPVVNLVTKKVGAVKDWKKRFLLSCVVFSIFSSP
jgi:hypothetical protein